MNPNRIGTLEVELWEDETSLLSSESAVSDFLTIEESGYSVIDGWIHIIDNTVLVHKLVRGEVVVDLFLPIIFSA